MNPSYATDRKRRTARLGVEALEHRELLTAGAGDSFAIILGSIDKPGGTVSIPFTIDPTHFHLPRGSLTLGIDIMPASGSGLKPLISAVNDPHGKLIPQTFHSIYNPHLSHLAVASGQGSSAVLTPVSFFPHDPSKPATYTVNVTAEGNTSGSFLLDFYLPGDANGTGTVDQASIQTIKAALGSRVGQPNYNFNADTNRDGRIGKIDLAVAHQNLGVSTTISPIVTANLDPASDSGLADRITNLQSVHFFGTATPGATVTYTETTGTGSNPIDFTTTTDANGNYSLMVTLAAGVNNLHVTTRDAFGQSISGDIMPVTYSPTAPETLITVTPQAAPKTVTAQGSAATPNPIV